MHHRIITSGSKFLDIDAFACLVAYNELMDLIGNPSTIVTAADPNKSVPHRFISRIILPSACEVHDNKKFIIMDVSDPKYIDPCVDIESVEYIFDHHPGFNIFWQQRIGKNAIIEPIGAAATLIVREYKKHNLLPKISPISAELLALAILSNTLYFQLKISTKEDFEAYNELKQYFFSSKSFEKEYFEEVQNNIENNLQIALKTDCKSFGDDLCIAQLEVWNANSVIDKKDIIEGFLLNQKEKIAFINIVELEKKRSLWIFRDEKSLSAMQKIFPYSKSIEQNIIITPHAILRKEILQKWQISYGTNH